MYEFVKIVLYALVFVMVFFAIVSFGQFVEAENPGDTLPFNAAAYCFVGALALAIGCAIYELGMETAQKEQEPDEDISRDSTT